MHKLMEFREIRTLSEEIGPFDEKILFCGNTKIAIQSGVALKNRFTPYYLSHVNNRTRTKNVAKGSI